MKKNTGIILILFMGLIIQQPLGSALPEPVRIVSINLCTDELLLRLADREKIIAVSKYSAKESNSSVFEEARSIAKTGGDIEEIMSFNPDLVVASIFTNHETMNMLERLKIPTIILNVPANFEEIYENINILGEALNETERALSLINEMKEELSTLKLKQEGQPLRAVFYQSGGNVPGLKTFQDAILKQVGLVSLAEELKLEGHNRVSLEELIFSKPDVLILVDLHQNRTSIGKEILFHPALKKGLKDSKVITLPSKYMHCGAPSSTKAVKLLRTQILEPQNE